MTTALWFYYIMFLIGYLLHAGLQINAAVRSSKTAKITRGEVVKENVVVLGSRLFISFLLLNALRLFPSLLGPIFGFAGITIPSIAITTSHWLFAGAWGFMVDTIATFIPVVRNYVPPIQDVVIKVEQATTEQAGQPTKVITTVTAQVPTTIPVTTPEPPKKP